MSSVKVFRLLSTQCRRGLKLFWQEEINHLRERAQKNYWLTIAQSNQAIGMPICGTSLEYGTDAIIRQIRQENASEKLGVIGTINYIDQGINTWLSDPECRWIDAPEDSAMHS